jgi:hypothetical protein
VCSCVLGSCVLDSCVVSGVSEVRVHGCVNSCVLDSCVLDQLCASAATQVLLRGWWAGELGVVAAQAEGLLFVWHDCRPCHTNAATDCCLRLCLWGGRLCRTFVTAALPTATDCCLRLSACLLAVCH